MSVRNDKKLDQRSPESAEVGESFSSRRLMLCDKTSGLRFLVDTGSDVSIIPATKSDRLSEPIPFLLHAANGTSIRTYSTKFFSTDLGLRRKLTWNFLVADVSHALIGADFLAHFGLLVDLRNKALTGLTEVILSMGCLLNTALSHSQQQCGTKSNTTFHITS